jgi:HPt (histidine-containing phosphotransfer) domain-containing protein
MQDRETDKSLFQRSAELQGQMEKIGGRFLERVLADFDAMEQALSMMAVGDASAVAKLEMFAHRIHGSSAIFGFAAVSETAGALEALLASGQVQGSPVNAVPAIAKGLAAVRAAAKAALEGCMSR